MEDINKPSGDNNKPVPEPIPQDPNRFKLPTPVYPKMELPTPPAVEGISPVQGYKPNCEGLIEIPPDPATSPIKPPEPGKSRVLIGIPLLTVTFEFLDSFLKFWTELILNKNPNYDIGYCFAHRKPVHMAEEFLVNVAQYNKCTHILFMDDDIYDIHRADLEKLLASDKDVIGGVMHASKFPHAMCVFRRFNPELKVIDMPVDNSIYRLYEVPCICCKCKVQLSHWDMKFCPACGAANDNIIQQADLIPFAFTLMKLSVFDKIKKPWFHCTTKYPTDSWFADRLIEAGLTEYGHMGIRLNHAGINDNTKPHYVNMGMQKAQQQKAVIILTPEDMDKHQFMLMNKMKETEAKMREKPIFVGEKEVINAEHKDASQTLISHGA